MLTKEPTSEQIKDWKRIFETYHSSILPNRKSGIEIDDYFRSKYPYQIYDNANFKKIVELNIIENEYLHNKLPNEMKPNVKTYCINDILIGIDLVSGAFHIECEDINKVVPIYDDLFVYRGLDEEDLKNYFLVAEYVKLTQN